LAIAALAFSFAFQTGDTKDTNQPEVGDTLSSESCKIFRFPRTHHLSASLVLVEGWPTREALAEVSSSIWGASRAALFATAALALAKAPAFLALAVFVTTALALAKVPAIFALLVTPPLATSAVTGDFPTWVLTTPVAKDFPTLVTIAGCMNPMMRMDDGDELQWIRHMNSIAAWVASCCELPVKRERRTNEGPRGRNKCCDRWLGDMANVYAVITKNRRITVTIVEYHGMSQQEMWQ
jgi:hypothetical protein